MPNIDSNSVITWNNRFYGKTANKKRVKFYKSSTVRFDDSMGGTEEITMDEYLKVAERYAKIIYGR